jgi:RNA polymerase sigma-70 factor (ECF subfamily)
MDRDNKEMSSTENSVSDFMKLVFENERRIYAYIYVLVPNQVEADDLFQDTVTIMWEKYKTYIPNSDFGAWGVGIAYNLVRNYRRKKARSRFRFSEDVEQFIEGDTNKALSNLDYTLEALKQCLSKLDTEDKKIIRLKFEHNFSTEEIAAKIGYSMKSIYVKLARANDFLVRCIRNTLAEQNV